jgi:hypothetical protein
MVEQYGELSSYSHHGSFLCVLATAFCDLLAVAP